MPDRQVAQPSKKAQDEQLSERLWKLTEQALGEKIVSFPYMTTYVDPMAHEGLHGHVEGRPLVNAH